MAKDYSRCQYCKRPYTEQDIRERNERKSIAMDASRERRKKLGLHIGRPKTRNDAAIWELRDKGLTMRKIANELKISTWTVQTSLKERQA